VLPVLTTNQKGAIAEAAIARAALISGYDVYRPMFEGGRYDLIFDTSEELLRIQYKWAPLYDNVIIIRSYRSRRNADGLLRRRYERGEFDALGAYCAKLDRCYLIPYDAIDGAVQVQPRVAPTRNNQHVGVRLAAHYEFGATLPQTQLGPIAQLGERRHGMAEVAGSIPAGSTRIAPVSPPEA
jgi:PD-(D/E)XK endonuclease